MFKNISHASKVLVFAILASCSQAESGSGVRSRPSSKVLNADTTTKCNKPLNIINGVEIEETEHPEVVAIKNNSFCTATWIAKNLLLTAAHCVKDQLPYIEKDEAKIYPSHHYVSPHFKDISDFVNTSKIDLSEIPNDVAFLWFDKGQSNSYKSICTTEIKRRDDVTIVGFGLNREEQNAPTKRFGENEVSGISSTGIIEIVTTAFQTNDQGKFAASASGDSGGPMLRNDCIQGIVSGGGYNPILPVKSSYYADLTSENNREIIERLQLGEDHIEPIAEASAYNEQESVEGFDSSEDDMKDSANTEDGC